MKRYSSRSRWRSACSSAACRRWPPKRAGCRHAGANMQRPGLAAAWRQAVLQLLRRLPLAEVHALLAHGRGPGPDRGGGDAEPQLHRRQVRRDQSMSHMPADDAAQVVRQGAAGPVAGVRAKARRLGLRLPQLVLPGSEPPGGLEQHRVPECLDAQSRCGSCRACRRP